MEAAEILRIAQTDDAPQDWIIVPLHRNKVLFSVISWSGAAIFGAALFALFFWMVWPNNFQNGWGPTIFSVILLAVPIFILVGSLWTVVVELGRLRTAREQVIIITPTDFVKQAGKHITHVPLSQVEHITVRVAPKRPDPAIEMSSATTQMGRMLFGGRSRSRLKAPPSLAFIDARTNKKVVVATDDSFADLGDLGDVLLSYVDTYRSSESSRARGL